MPEKIYRITHRGLEDCPKGETYIEKFDSVQEIVAPLLRLLRDSGPKTEKEIIGHFSPKYNVDRIKHMLIFTEYCGYISSKKPEK
jgi:hypothetical protein